MNQNHRYRIPLQDTDHVLFRLTEIPGREQQQRYIYLSSHLLRPGHSHAAQVTVIIYSRGIDKDTGAEAEYLHALTDRIRGGARMIRHDGNRLTYKGIDKRRLTHIPSSEYSDIDSCTHF